MLDKVKLAEDCEPEYEDLTNVFRESWSFFGERDLGFRGCLFTFSNNQYAVQKDWVIIGSMTGSLKDSLGHLSGGVPPMGLAVGPLITDILPKAHKLYDTIIGSILPAESQKLRYKDKIKEYEARIRESNLKLPTFFSENIDLHNAFFQCYKDFTKYRNHIYHKHGIDITRQGDLVLSDGQVTTIYRNDIEEFVKLGLAIRDELIFEGERIEEDKAKHIAYRSAKALFKYHKQKLDLPHPVIWYQVHFGLGCSDLDVNSQMTWTVDLDRIFQVIHDNMPPEFGESKEHEITIYLDSPEWVTMSNTYPKFIVPMSKIKQGGLFELARRDFVSSS